MKRFLNIKLNILEIILLISPILDIVTSIAQRSFNIDISLGLIVRAFLMIFLIAFMFFKSDYKNKKNTVIYLILIAVYTIIFSMNIHWNMNKGNNQLLKDLKELIKTFYFPICLITMMNYFETTKYKLNLKVLWIVLIEYVVLLFIPCIFNLGYESYVEDKIGTIGWYYAANEISAIYSILIALIIFSHSKIKNKFVYFFIQILCIYTVLQIGTKIPAIAIIISICVFVLANLIRFIYTKDKSFIKNIFIYGGITGIIFIVILAKSPVMKNFDIYKNYLISTRITQMVDSNAVEEKNESIEEKVKTEEIKKVDEVEETRKQQRVENIQEQQPTNSTTTNIENQDTNLTNDEIATIIHSGRIETLKSIKNIFDGSPVVVKMFGLGKIGGIAETYYLTEIDYFDILFEYGYVGFAIYFIPLLVFAGLIIKKIYKKGFKNCICDDNKWCYFLIIANGLVCAVAGHTLVAPAVSIYIAIAIIQWNRELE